ncbi:MAG: glycosyltransferase family 4 protein [Desulfamplus sp.]|nr:glycosyltransferase family 4 protein [Desulfamplus sp.]
MKILHIISQAPDFTGSGKYIQAILKCSADNGHENFLVAGVQSSGDQSNGLQRDFFLNSEIISPEKTMFVRFNGIDLKAADLKRIDLKVVDLDYPLPGMSDVMPYKSTIFSTLTPSQITDYEEAFARVIKKAVNEFKPDIIHSHHLWIVSALTRELFPDIPMVTTCHGTCLRQFALCEDIGRRISLSIKKINKIMALSNYQKEQIMQIHNIPSEKIYVVGGGYDEKLFSFTKKSSPPPVEILYAGKLSRSKGVVWLLRAFKKIAENHLLSSSLPILHLHLAGGGSGLEKDECIELANELESAFKSGSNSDVRGSNNDFRNSVRVHGALSHEELSALMKKAHIFILPSFFEGLPLVLMEALACGCRIITTSLPGTCEVLGSCDSALLESSDSSISSNINNNMVTLVELPELETVDKPYSKDLEEIETRLCEHISSSIQNLVKNPEPNQKQIEILTQNYTWNGVFKRIERIYSMEHEGIQPFIEHL